jgi:hypothetical protein
MRIATGQIEDTTTEDGKNAAAVALGRMGGKDYSVRFAVARLFRESGLIVATVGAYSENGPVGADINPRRVRLIARRR